jgi:hypothetical protein
MKPRIRDRSIVKQTSILLVTTGFARIIDLSLARRGLSLARRARECRIFIDEMVLDSYAIPKLPVDAGQKRGNNVRILSTYTT